MNKRSLSTIEHLLRTDLFYRNIMKKKFKTQEEWKYLEDRTDLEERHLTCRFLIKRDVYDERHLATVSMFPYCPTCKARVVDVNEVYVDGKEARQCNICKNNIPSFVKSVYQ
jgi:hypothetical protein